MPEKTKGKEVINDLVEGTKKLISRIRDDVDGLSSKGKLKIDIISLKNKRGRVFRELGMKTYVLIKNKKYEIPEVKTLMKELGDLEKEIDQKEKQAREITAHPVKAGAKKEAKPKTAETTATKKTASGKKATKKTEESKKK